mgnify:CR=1 FL=1
MRKLDSEELFLYDREIVKLINEKYNISFMEAFKKFINSKTYKMLENKELAMNYFSTLAIFDMWEAEIVTGSPLNSVYLRTNYE